MYNLINIVLLNFLGGIYFMQTQHLIQKHVMVTMLYVVRLSVGFPSYRCVIAILFLGDVQGGCSTAATWTVAPNIIVIYRQYNATLTSYYYATHKSCKNKRMFTLSVRVRRKKVISRLFFRKRPWRDHIIYYIMVL